MNGLTVVLIAALPYLLKNLKQWYVSTKNYNPRDPNDPINIEKSRRIHRGH